MPGSLGGMTAPTSSGHRECMNMTSYTTSSSHSFTDIDGQVLCMSFQQPSLDGQIGPPARQLMTVPKAKVATRQVSVAASAQNDTCAAKLQVVPSSGPSNVAI